MVANQKRPEDEWVCFGEVGAAHGIRGAFFCDGRDRELFDYKSIRVDFGLQSIFSKVKRVYLSGGRPVLELESVNGRNAAEALRGAKLFVQRGELVLNQDEFLAVDLIGTDVFDEAGLFQGKIKAVHEFGAQPNLEIELNDASSIFFPFISAFIVDHNIEEKRISVRNIDAFKLDSKSDPR